MRKRLVGIFLKVANKQITRMRAGKRLVKIRTWLDENGITSREDCRHKVTEDFKNAQNVQLGSNEADTDNILNVPFKFSFFTKEIQSDIKLPLEYETNIASFMEKIDAQPVVNFDDLEPFDSLEQLDFEVMKYLPMVAPQVSSYDPIFNDKVYRPGCNYESTLRQISGEPDLEKIQIAAHE